MVDICFSCFYTPFPSPILKSKASHVFPCLQDSVVILKVCFNWARNETPGSLLPSKYNKQNPKYKYQTPGWKITHLEKCWPYKSEDQTMSPRTHRHRPGIPVILMTRRWRWENPCGSLSLASVWLMSSRLRKDPVSKMIDTISVDDTGNCPLASRGCTWTSSNMHTTPPPPNITTTTKTKITPKMSWCKNATKGW